jgi:hypothetical protein
MLHTITFDPSFTDYETGLIQQFSDAAEHRSNIPNIFCDEYRQQQWTITSIAEEINLPILDFHKEGLFIQALWVIFLDIMRRQQSVTSSYKYPDLPTFLLSYPGAYLDVDIDEQTFLWQTANWMSILFEMIPARKNKGLAMQVN